MRGVMVPAKFIPRFNPDVEVLDISVDKKLDVYVIFRWHSKITKSMLRIDEYGERYFNAAKTRIYYADLRKVVNV